MKPTSGKPVTTLPLESGGTTQPPKPPEPDSSTDEQDSAISPKPPGAEGSSLAHRKSKAAEGRSYLQRFDDQCRTVTRKIDTFASPGDKALEHGVKVKKGKGKKKKEPDVQAGALVPYEGQIASVKAESGATFPVVRKRFTDLGEFQSALANAREQGIQLLPTRPEDVDVSVAKPSKKSVKKAGGKHAEKLQQRVDVLAEFERLGLLLDAMTPSFKVLQQMLNGLPPEQKELQWLHPMYQTLHANCLELVAGVEEFLEDNPETDMVKKNNKIRAIIHNRGDEYFYRSVARIREFLLLYYYQNAQCISHKVVMAAKKQFSEEGLRFCQLDKALAEDFTGVTCFYCLALEHLAALHTLYRCKIHDRHGRQKALKDEGSGIVNGYYSLVSGMVSLAHSERLRLKEVMSEEEATACFDFVGLLFDTCLDSLRNNNFLKPIRRCDQFYQSSGSTVSEQMESQCRRVVTGIFLLDQVSPVRAIKELALLTDRADAARDHSYVVKSFVNMPEKQQLLYQECMRSCIDVFVQLQASLSDDDDLALHRLKLKALEQTAGSMSSWWNRVFPPGSNQSLAESRRILKNIERDARQVRQNYDQRIAGQHQAIRTMAASLEAEEDRRIERERHRTEKMQRKLDRLKQQSSTEPSSDNTEPVASAREEVSDDADDLALLQAACHFLKQHDYSNAKHSFLKLINSGQLAGEHRVWALYGAANCHMGIIAKMFQNQCNAARDYLENYEAIINQGQLPPYEMGRLFHEQLMAFRDGLKEIFLNAVVAKRYFHDLMEMMLKDDSDWCQDPELVEAVADSLAECHQVVTPLCEFSQRVGTLYHNRGALLAERQSDRQPRKNEQLPDFKKAIDDVANLTTRLQEMVADLGGMLHSRSDQLTRFDEKEFLDQFPADQNKT